MLGRIEKTVLDCPDPRALAAFYGEILGMRVNEDTDGDWVVIGRGEGMRELAFQKAEPYVPPRWPDDMSSIELRLASPSGSTTSRPRTRRSYGSEQRCSTPRRTPGSGCSPTPPATRSASSSERCGGVQLSCTHPLRCGPFACRRCSRRRGGSRQA